MSIPTAYRGLSQAGDWLWLSEGDIVDFYTFPCSTRMVIAQLPGDRLWVWSPVRLNRRLRDEVNALGTPDHLVSPNLLHHLYLQEWKAEWPSAKIWGPASTILKRGDLSFEAPLEHDPPAAWASEIDQVWFRGSRVMDEMVFFHKPSRTVIFADLTVNFSEQFLRAHWSWWRRVIAHRCGIVEGRGYAPLEMRLTWFDRTQARLALEKVLTWNPERVVMAHGELVESDATGYLRRAFRWLD